MQAEKMIDVSPKKDPKEELIAVLKNYVNKGSDDPVIAALLEDRKIETKRVNEYSKELKACIDEVQAKAVEIQTKTADANGVIKYVDSKIVQRHLELTRV